MIARLIRTIRSRIAARRLARVVEQQRESYECRRYRERRAAALRGMGRAA